MNDIISSSLETMDGMKNTVTLIGTELSEVSKIMLFLMYAVSYNYGIWNTHSHQMNESGI